MYPIIKGYAWAADGHLYSKEELAEMPEGLKPEPLKVVWINAYRVSRHYGGPEEGGWWYDNYTCIGSMPLSTDHPELNNQIDLIKRMMTSALGWEPDAYEKRHGGSRYTVNGGSDFAVLAESSYQASETHVRPHYE